MSVDQDFNPTDTEAQAKAHKTANDEAARARRAELEDLRAVLSTAQGRRVLWRVLVHCKVFESVWHSSALIHKNAGRQDVGHFLMGEIETANQESLFTMMKEARGGNS